MRDSMDFLGLHFLLTVVAIEHLLQGFVFGGGTGGVVGIPFLFLMRSFGTLTASRIQVLRTISVSPWTLKPIFGIISDVFYIRGYNKIPYILVTLVWAILACLLIVFTWPLSPIVSTMLFFVLFLQIAVADLLLEAKYTHKVKDRPDVNPDLMSFVHFCTASGQLVSLVLTGLLVPVMPLKYLYLIPILPFCITLYPVAKNWLEDEPYNWLDHVTTLREEVVNGTKKRVVRWTPLVNACDSRLWYHRGDQPSGPDIPLFGLDVEKIKKNWRIFLLGLIIVAIALITNVMGLLNVPLVYLFVFSVLSGPLMIVAFFALVDRRIAMIQTFTIIQNMCSVPLEGALFFFFTDNAEAYPEGPHFSDRFYITGIGIIAALLYIGGIALYNMFMTDWKFRNILLTTNAIYVLVSLPNIALFLRWNKAWGIPDQLFVLSTEALQVLINTWTNMPLVVIMNQLCPKGVEATSYALLAGCSNLGYALSQYQGAFILDVLGIRPMGLPGESAQFDNLWIAGVISVFLPLFPLCAVNFLIPDGAQTDNIIARVEDSDDEDNNQAVPREMGGNDEGDEVDYQTPSYSTSYTTTSSEDGDADDDRYRLTLNRVVNELIQ